MSVRDMLVEAGFLSAKAASLLLKETGATEETIQLMRRLDEIALELLRTAKRFDRA